MQSSTSSKRGSFRSRSLRTVARTMISRGSLTSHAFISQRNDSSRSLMPAYMIAISYGETYSDCARVTNVDARRRASSSRAAP